jgi:nitrogen-specific signal transduction histidine kinase
MTERRAAEAERHALLQARIRSEETNRAKDEFLMTLSHELRTPMTSILGWSRLLASGVLGPDEQRTAIQAIEQSATAQATLIDEVLDVSRLIAGKLRLKMQAVDISQVAAEAVVALKPVADLKQVSLVTEIADGLELIAADRDRLRQIIWNLVSNAVKFSREGQKVTIAVRQIQSDLEIAVRDQGEGIAPEFVPFVFEPFMQADSSATRRHGGLGLGLTIVRNLVELHGGTARAESAGRGRGATFRITIPMGAVIDRSDASGRQPGMPDSTIAGAHVLFVDDHAPSRALVTSILQHAGTKVECAGSVEEALDRLHDSSPDLIITDIAMPGRDGFDLLRAVRQHADEHVRKIPMIAFTAFGKNDGHTDFKAWLKKPIEPEDLVSAVASAIGRS